METEKENWQHTKVEIQYRYAWDWFSYHAAQRLMGFRFFLIIIGGVFVGYLRLLTSKSPIFAGYICVFGAFISLGFFFLEIRNEELVNCGRHSLDKLEGQIDMQIRNNDKERECLKESLGPFIRWLFCITEDWRPTKKTCIEKLTRHRCWLRSIYTIVLIIFFALAILTFLGKI